MIPTNNLGVLINIYDSDNDMFNNDCDNSYFNVLVRLHPACHHMRLLMVNDYHLEYSISLSRVMAFHLIFLVLVC